MAARQNHVSVPTGTDQQRRCARDRACSSKTRDPETMEWNPAAGNPLCPRDAEVLVACLGELPGIYERLAARSLDPPRTGRAVRVPPGSRVLVSPDADALMRDLAAWVAGWAARVRSVPGLQLARHGHPHGSPGQVAADCGTLAAHHVPLLALAPAPVARTWTFPAGRDAPAGQRPYNSAWRWPPFPPPRPAPRPVPCRRCSLPLAPSPSGKYWWPAVCTHARAEPVTETGPDDAVTVLAFACHVCGKRLPASWRPAACAHQPADARAAPPSGMPTDLEDELDGLEVIRSGDGWVTAWTDLGGDAAALDIFDLRRDGVKLLMETPAPRDLLDGVPCRKCDAMSSLEVLPRDPPDPEKPEPKFCRCSAGSCGDEMTRPEYDDWVAKYDSFARGAGVKVCRRCQKDLCRDCAWASCACGAGPHPRRRAAA